MFLASYDRVAFRIALDLLFLVVLLFVPWWVSTLVLILLIFYFKKYYETFVAGLLLDGLFAAPTAALGDFLFFYTALFTALFFVTLYIKDHLRVEY